MTQVTVMCRLADLLLLPGHRGASDCCSPDSLTPFFSRPQFLLYKASAYSPPRTPERLERGKALGSTSRAKDMPRPLCQPGVLGACHALAPKQGLRLSRAVGGL